MSWKASARIRNSAHLLTHYARTAGGDLQAWQDRVLHMDGVRVDDLIKLHGELIAYEWIEQNTGVLPALHPANCRSATA